MRIEHLTVWVKDLERMKDFYSTYFETVAGERYHNPNKNFTSYFLSFNEGPRLELMYDPNISENLPGDVVHLGLAHFAISVGSREKVVDLTEKLGNSGFEIVGEPRTTGDGYYESVVLDPENNRIEITE